jgi:hypothetical protein
MKDKRIRCVDDTRSEQTRPTTTLNETPSTHSIPGKYTRCWPSGYSTLTASPEDASPSNGMNRNTEKAKSDYTICANITQKDRGEVPHQPLETCHLLEPPLHSPRPIWRYSRKVQKRHDWVRIHCLVTETLVLTVIQAYNSPVPIGNSQSTKRLRSPSMEAGTIDVQDRRVKQTNIGHSENTLPVPRRISDSVQPAIKW